MQDPKIQATANRTRPAPKERAEALKRNMARRKAAPKAAAAAKNTPHQPASAEQRA